MEKSPGFNGTTHYKLLFSLAMLYKLLVLNSHCTEQKKSIGGNDPTYEDYPGFIRQYPSTKLHPQLSESV